MSAVHALALPLALLATACLPVVVAALICADELLDHLGRRIARRRQQRRERRLLNRFDRAFEVDPHGRIDPTELDRVDGPTIQQLAADLRRLADQRWYAADRSGPEQQTLLEAYDDRLRLASQRLGVPEHLGELTGVDREIERVRVEGELEAAGLVLRTPHAGPRRPAG
ncbi:hypothetical protein [Plantactinospora sp. B24E8]|uniref:hypothetical protein n=1 Tax=Plantactinospora sp. B24E8 TaxID=3153567 RepID=UPI00325E187A